MAVYVFNLVVGYKANGVDNAQGYRAKMFRRFLPEAKYIFTELPYMREVKLYAKAGISTEQMLSIHQYYTDTCSAELSINVEEKLCELKESLQYTEIKYEESRITLQKNGVRAAVIMLDEDKEGCFYKIQFFNHERLVRVENYVNGLFFVDHYVTVVAGEKADARLSRRTFYNCNGSIAYEQLFRGDKERYLFPNNENYTNVKFIAEFIKGLRLTEKDTVLIDRSGCFDFVQPLFQFGNKARFITVFHSGHFFEKGEDPCCLGMNYEYYYWFRYSKLIDTMVVSTPEQKTELIEKLHEYQCEIPAIKVIPVGAVDRLRYPETRRKKCSIVTVSRLNPRKKIEWVIKSAIKAQKMNERISLDIYGELYEDEYCRRLKEIVFSSNAQEYIRFMGYTDVTEIYKNYEVYISASLGETFGLSVMEAAASGAALIGLDVKYGNRLFISPDENGYLVDFDLSHIEDDEQITDKMAEYIVKVFEDEERLERFHHKSYEISKDYLCQVIEEKWKKLLNGCS